MNGTTSRSFWAALIGSAVIALPVPTMVGAQTRLYSFDIPAGPVDDTLRRYARITGRQLLYRPEAVRGRQSRAIAGQLTADDALAQILRDTGLADRRPAANVVVIEPSPAAAPSNSGQASVTDTELHQDVVVTGSNIRGAAGQIAPVRTITRADLERSGQASFADVIATLPQNFGGSGNPVASLTGADQSSLNNTVAPAANLRGLGTDATLTLFNGRRVAGSGGRGDFTDLSAIPTLAVERVEILTDGASAIYGSDAVGGVVNLILRERQDGVEARIRGTTATDGSFRNGLAGFSAGHTWSSGAVFLAYEFEHRDELLASARSYTATGDLRPFGGTDHRTYLSVPGTLLDFDPASGNLVPIYAVPTLPAGVQPTAAQFPPGQNFTNPLAGTALSPEFSRHAVYVHIDQALASSLDVFAEGRFARRTFAYAGPASSGVFLVTPANPYFVSVAGAPYSIEGYSFANDLGATRLEGGVTSFSATAGLTYRPGSNWTIDAYGSFSRERSHDRQSNIANTTALDEALGNIPDDPVTAFSTAANGFFNPYGSGSANSRTILNFVGDGFAALSRSSSVGQGSIKSDGPLFSLPGGAVKAAIGADYRRETFARGGSLLYYGDAPMPASSGDNARDVKAVFAEIDVPIVGAANASTLLRSLILTAAVRHERYSDFGSTTNPKVGAAWRPADGVLLRGSWGTSFRAPALPELNDRLAVGPTQVQNASGAYVPVLYLSGGNPALGPEKATSFTGGMVLEPRTVPGLRFETSFFSTRFRDQIGQPVLQDIQHALTNPALAPYVQLITPATNAGDLTRVDALLATPGAMSTAGVPPTAFQAIIDARYVNTSSLLVSGLDQEIHLTRPIGRDRIDVDFAATWLFTYTSRPTPLSPEQRRLDTVGNPSSLRFRSSATWEHGALAATAIANYVDGYVDKTTLPYRAVSAFVTIDADIGFAPKRGFLRASRLSLSVLNLLDRAPPFVDAATGLGFDAANANPFGRTVSIEFATKF